MIDAGSPCGGRNVALSRVVASRSRLELPESGSYLRSNLLLRYHVCMRDYYVTAAIFAAYGAECEARLGRDQEAKQESQLIAPDRPVRARLRIRLLLRILDAQSGRLHHLSRRYDERQAGSDHRTGAFARAARSPNRGGSACPRKSLLCALARRRLGCYARISPSRTPNLVQVLGTN
jgi:hypothetical protein